MSNNSYYNDQWRILSNENQNKVSNYSCEFDGTNDNITLDNTGDFLNLPYLSISIWFKPIAISGFGDCILNNSYFNSGFMGYGINCYPDRRIRFVSKVTGADFTTDLYNFNKWNHFAATYDATNGLTLYLNNGSPINFPTPTTPLFYTGSDLVSNNVTIGSAAAGGSAAAPEGPTQHFNGSIDQVNIFDYTLSASQVSTLYGGGTALTNPMALNPAPVAYYQLGDQSVDNGANYLVPNNSLQDYLFDFNGTQNINIDNEITLPNNHSLSFWLNFDTIPTASGAGPIPLSSSTNNYYPMITAASGKIQLYIKGTVGFINKVTNTALIANTWYHIVVTSDGTNALYYINGGADSGVIGSARTGVSIKSIGSRLNGASRSLFVDGRMSNVAIWSGTTLTSSQVTTLYNNGAPTDISSLSPTAWYKLNAQDTFDGTNWTIKDSAGTNNGTSSGMTSANLIVSDLQHTSGFSPYALSFAADDSIEIPTNTNLEITGNITISAWIKSSSSSLVSTKIINKRNASISNFDFFLDTGGKKLKFYDGTNNTASDITITLGIWNHVAITIRSGVTNGSVFYINGIGQTSNLPTFTIASNTAPLVIGANFTRNGTFFNGDISNVSIFNYNLSSTEITEIYNQGVPSNLNTFSGTAPVGWWQLGSNSSFNTNWTCLDEIGTSNGVSTNMTNDDITNGPGYSANGLGTSSIDIIGNAPYSSGNGLSENMDVLDRVKDTPPS